MPSSRRLVEDADEVDGRPAPLESKRDTFLVGDIQHDDFSVGQQPQGAGVCTVAREDAQSIARPHELIREHRADEPTAAKQRDDGFAHDAHPCAALPSRAGMAGMT